MHSLVEGDVGGFERFPVCKTSIINISLWKFASHNRILAIDNLYGLIHVNKGYIDYFFICFKDLYRLVDTQHPIINLYKSVLIHFQ